MVKQEEEKSLKSQPVPPGSIRYRGVEEYYGNNCLGHLKMFKSNSTYLITPNYPFEANL